MQARYVVPVEQSNQGPTQCHWDRSDHTSPEHPELTGVPRDGGQEEECEEHHSEATDRQEDTDLDRAKG